MSPLKRKAPRCPSGRSGHVWIALSSLTPDGYTQQCRHCHTVRHMSQSHVCRGYTTTRGDRP